MTNKFVFFICFIINPFLLLADNWEPFPLNQISYYKITEVTKTQEIVFYEEEDLIGSIGIINFDSCFIQSENQKEYYSKKINILKTDSCIVSKMDSLKKRAYDLLQFTPDSYKIIDDTVTFNLNYFSKKNNPDLKIPLNMEVNDTFFQKHIDSLINFSVEVKITLISIVKVHTFGLDDSVQVFKVERKRLPKANDGIFTLILSKKFGFVSLIPLDILFINPLSIKLKKMELVTAQIDLQVYGDTFNFKSRKRNYLEKKGDVRIYKYFWRKNESPEFECRRDSIIGFDEVGDEVIVFYNRQTFSSDPGTHPHQDKTDSYKYKKSDSVIYWGYNAMIDELKNGSTFIPNTKLFDKVPNIDTPNKNDSLEIIATPLLFKIVERCGQESVQIFYVYQADLNRVNCSLQSEFFMYNIADEKIDRWWEHIETLDVYPDRVIGYRDGECVWGDITWPPKGVSVKVVADETDMLISPNPATDYINVDLSFLRMQVSAIQIFDIFGNEIHPPRLASQATPQEGNFRIDITTLPSGVYFIRIGNVKPAKFIKI